MPHLAIRRPFWYWLHPREYKSVPDAFGENKTPLVVPNAVKPKLKGQKLHDAEKQGKRSAKWEKVNAAAASNRSNTADLSKLYN